jgi:hypothetical protein
VKRLTKFSLRNFILCQTTLTLLENEKWEGRRVIQTVYGDVYQASSQHSLGEAL